MNRLLVVKRDKIGDMLLTTPLLAHLRERLPSTRIEVLCTDYNAWVLDGNPNLDRRWVLPRVRIGPSLRWRAVPIQIFLRTRLRFAFFDAVIVAQGEESPRAVRLGLSVQSGKVAAYAASAARYGRRLTHELPEPAEGVHEVDRMIGLATTLGIAPPDVVPHPFFALPDRARRFAQTWLSERGLELRRYVVLGLGARRATRQPSAAQAERWARWWWERFGLQTVFIWTPGRSDSPIYPGDDDIAEPVLRRQLSFLHPYRGPLIEALGLISHAQSSVLPDSGLMHFGAASPGGVVGLFASDGPPAWKWGPRGARVGVVQAESDVPSMPDSMLFGAVEPLLTTTQGLP